jgi:hypothetical protein
MIMAKTEQVAAEYQRRKDELVASGFTVEEFGIDDLLIVEMSMRDEQTGEVVVRKQEGVAFQDRTEFIVECRKLMALERLSNVVPQMWLTHTARLGRECRRNH